MNQKKIQIRIRGRRDDNAVVAHQLRRCLACCRCVLPFKMTEEKSPPPSPAQDEVVRRYIYLEPNCLEPRLSLHPDQPWQVTQATGEEGPPHLVVCGSVPLDQVSDLVSALISAAAVLQQERLR